MWQVFQMTRKYDSRALPFMLIVFLAPIVVGVLLSIFLDGNILTQVLWIVAGVLVGVLLAILVLGRRAEHAAYSQIAGQPGAVGAVLRSSLRRGWRGNEMPVKVDPKSRDAVYLAVGRGGVVLIGEGSKTRTDRMISEQRSKISRVVPNVPITALNVGPDSGSVPLHRVARELGRIKPTLNKTEVVAVDNRLASLSSNAGMAIPKGVDPLRVRAPRQPR